MKFSLKIASAAIGFALLAGAAAASAQVSTIWTGTTTTATKNPEFNMVRIGSSLPTAPATTTPIVASIYFQLVMASSTGMSSSTSACPVVTSYMKMGAANDKTGVLKLQAFLKGHEGLDVDMTGIFDKKTETAVEAFQHKYASDILAPWGATRASGAVSVTTGKKINELVCGTEMALSSDEKSLVASYQNAAVAASAQGSVSESGTMTAVAPAMPTVTMDSDASASGHVSMMSRFWHFIGSFFKK